MKNFIDTYFRGLVYALAMFTAIIRIPNIGNLSFFADYDEYFTAKTVSGIYEEKIGEQSIVRIDELRSDSFGEIIYDANNDNGNSFLYNFCLHSYCSVTGYTDVQMRTFSILCDVLAIFLIAAIGRKLKIPHQRILLAALFYAFFPALAMYGVTIRTYAFTTLLCLALFYVMLLAKVWKLLTSIIAISLLTLAVFLGHYLTYYVLGVFFVYAVLKFRSDRSYGIKLAGGLAAGGLLCFAFLAINLSQITNITQKNEKYREMTGTSQAEGNTRQLEKLDASTFLPKIVSYLDQYYTGNQYSIKWAKALGGEMGGLAFGILLLIFPALLILSAVKSTENSAITRLLLASSKTANLSVILLCLYSGHMIALGIKYTIFTIPFFLILVSFYAKRSIPVVLSFAVILGGSALTTVTALPSRGQKNIRITFKDQPDAAFQAKDKKQIVEKVSGLVASWPSDTLYLHGPADLVFLQMSGIKIPQHYARFVGSDSADSPRIGFRFSQPD